MEMRRMGEEMLVLCDDLGYGDDVSESEDDSEWWEGLEDDGVDGEREIIWREILENSCGCYDIGDKNFRLLTRNSRSKFAKIKF